MIPFNIKERSGNSWVQKCLQQSNPTEAASGARPYGNIKEPTEADLLLFAQACEVELRHGNGQWIASLGGREAQAALPLIAIWHLYFKTIGQPPQGVWCTSLAHDSQHLIFPDGEALCSATKPLGSQWMPTDEDNLKFRCRRCMGRLRALEEQRESASPKTAGED